MKLPGIVTISAFTATGDLQQLSGALNEGLDEGLTLNEIKEVLVQLYAYTGFPRSLNALNTFMNVLKERQEKGILDPEGKGPSSLLASRDKLELGTQIQTQLVGQPVKGALYDFAPAIDQFLKEHLFGDIFGRDHPDWKTRELATISALAALAGVENQLRSHFLIGIHNGLTPPQLNELVSIIESKVSAKQGETARAVLQSVVETANAKNEQIKTIEQLDGDAIFPDGQNAPKEYFTGTAWVNILVSADETKTFSTCNVVFEPGARTAWHTHPAGQILLVLDGAGWYQEKGKTARRLSKGSVVVFPSDTIHWHGAGQDSSLTHIAITHSRDGGVIWLEKVTQEEYLKVNKN